MKNKCIGFIVFTCLLCTAGYTGAQSKKDVKKLNIKSVTETITETVDGKETTHKTSFTKFNNAGNTIEFIDYNKDGSVAKKEVRLYNKSNDISEENTYDASGKLIEKIKFGYNVGGDKVSETITDASGKIIRRAAYSYNKNGLKTEKKVYNAANQLILVKKYSYEF